MRQPIEINSLTEILHLPMYLAACNRCVKRIGMGETWHGRRFNGYGLGALSLSVSKSNIPVGETGIFYVRGGPPNAKIYWSSKKNGIPTGEDLAYYGQNTDANGNLDLIPNPWTENTIGEWIKYVVIYDSAGKPYSAGVAFNVFQPEPYSKPIPNTYIPGSTPQRPTTAVDPGTYIDPLIVAPMTPAGETGQSQSSQSSSGSSSDTPAPSIPGYQPSLSGSSFFQKKFSVFGFSIPYYVPIGVGIGYFLLQKRR